MVNPNDVDVNENERYDQLLQYVETNLLHLLWRKQGGHTTYWQPPVGPPHSRERLCSTECVAVGTVCIGQGTACQNFLQKV